MSPLLMECEMQALKLEPKDRAALATHLIASLDELTEVQIEELWIAESERRYRAYKDGRLAGRLAEDVLRDARLAIRQ